MDRIWSRINLAFSEETCKNDPTKVVSSNFLLSLLRPLKKCCKRIGSGRLRSRPDAKSVVNRKAEANDSSDSCFIVRTLTLRSMIWEMG